MDGAKCRWQLLISGWKRDRKKRNQQDPQRAIKDEWRPRVAEEQSHAEHNPGNSDRRSRKKPEEPPAGPCVPCSDVGNYTRESRADSRGGAAEDHCILKRERSRRQLEKHEMNVLQREIVSGQERRCDWRERRVEKRGIRQKHGIEQHNEAQHESRPAPAVQRNKSRRPVFSTDNRVAAPSE